MSRPVTVHTGLSGEGQPIFPEGIKEFGRTMALTDSAVIWRNTPTDDGGGSPIDNWQPDAQPVRAIIEVLSKRPQAAELEGGKVGESASHIISFDPTVYIDVTCRVAIQGNMWVINALVEHTDALLIKVEVKRQV